ncbi:Bacterial mobilisation domain-containing protein, partial [Dysosmobacter welbionis]
QHAANLVQRLEHGDVIPLPGQIAGTGQARRAGAYHSYLVAVALRHGGSAALMAVGIVIVRHKPLQTADAHGLTLDAPDALALALVLLGADTAADGGQAVGGGDDAEGLVKLAFR